MHACCTLWAQCNGQVTTWSAAYNVATRLGYIFACFTADGSRVGSAGPSDLGDQFDRASFQPSLDAAPTAWDETDFARQTRSKSDYFRSSDK